MTNYRRQRIKGGCYFFTVNLADRRQTLLTDRIATLRQAFRQTQTAHPFTIEAIVILPDHLHTIWTMPEGDDDFRVRLPGFQGAAFLSFFPPPRHHWAGNFLVTIPLVG